MTQTPSRPIEDQVREALGDQPKPSASYARIIVPTDHAFAERDVKHLESSSLRDLARQLIANFPMDLQHLQDASGRFFWKQEGGRSGGRSVLGKTAKASGLARDLLGAPDYVVFLSADHVREFEDPDRQIPALLFHELCHVTVSYDREGEPNGYILRGHDYEGFNAELERFGAWKTDLAEARLAFGQLPLPEVA